MRVFRVLVVSMMITLGSMSFFSVSAMSLSPGWEDMLEKVKTEITKQERRQGSSYTNWIHFKIQKKMASTDDPWVRYALGSLHSRVDERYISKYANTRTTKTLLTLEGKPFLRNKHTDTSASSTSKKDKQDPVSDSVVATTASVITERERPVSLPETDTWDDRYILQDGRINLTTIRNTWIERVNVFRKQEWVNTVVTHQPLLDKTATERSIKMRTNGTRSHKRTATSGYYNYREIVRWFEDRWLTFTNISRATFTENVGFASLGCNSGDCTSAALKSLRDVFEFFINEKGTSYTAHYDTTVHPLFQEVGIGIAVDESRWLIYSTMHYATETKLTQ